MYIQFTEESLWDLWQFVRFNQKGLCDVCALLEALADQKDVLYQVDFSDIHPFLYPKQTRKRLGADDLSLHTRSVTFLWESLLDSDIANMPFQMTLNPGTRLEILESLWHAENRFHQKFRQYIPGEISKHVKFTRKGAYVKDLRELNAALAACDPSEFRLQVEALTSDEALSSDVRDPAGKLLDLLDSRIILPFEPFLSDEILAELVQTGPSEALQKKIQEYFRVNTRADEEKTSWTPRHETFHDLVDILNLCLAYFLRQSPTAQGLYSPIVTHTFRVIAAGNLISANPQNALVHHSVAPLYFARAVKIEGRRNLDSFFATGRLMIQEIAREVWSLPKIRELAALSHLERVEHFREPHFTRLPRRLYMKLTFFVKLYYGIVDMEELAAQEATEGEGDMEQEEPITVEYFVELLHRKSKAVEEVRNHAKQIKEQLGVFDSGLAGLFVPQKGHARDITEWISGL